MLSRIEGEAAEREIVLREVAVITRSAARNAPTVTIPDEQFEVLQIEGINRAELIEAQQGEFRAEYAEARDGRSENDYVLLGDVFASERLPYPSAPEYPRVIIPARWRNMLIEKAHLDVGHMSTVKTMRRLTEAYAWPGMKKDVRNRLKLDMRIISPATSACGDARSRNTC